LQQMTVITYIYITLQIFVFSDAETVVLLLTARAFYSAFVLCTFVR